MKNRHRSGARAVRRILAVAAAVAVVPLAACGGGDSAASSTTIASTTTPAKDRKPVTLQLWSSFTDQVAIDAFRPILERCQKDNPWLTIEYVAKDDMANAVAAAAEAGNLPDVIQADFAGGLAKLQASGVIQPLDDFARRDGFEWDQFTPGGQKLMRFDDQYWGLPLSLDTAALFVNEDVLGPEGLAAPTTFDELRTAAEKLVKRSPDGSIERIGWVPDVGDGSFVLPAGRLFGGRIFNDDGTKVVLADGDAWADSIRFQKEFFTQLGDPADVARFASSLGSYDSSENFFITGQVPLYTEASYFVTWPSRFGKGKPENWSVVPMPGPKGVADADKFALIASGNGFFVPTEPKAGDPEASWVAASCMATAAEQIAEFEVAQGNIPANIEALDLFEQAESTRIPEYKTFIDLARSPNPSVPDNAVIVETASDAIVELALKYRRGEIPDDQLESELSALQDRLQDELDLERGS